MAATDAIFAPEQAGPAQRRGTQALEDAVLPFETGGDAEADHARST